MTADRDLPSLVGSRICHDLVSPLGAIGNGLELIMMSGLGNSPELSLLAESIESASARIQFFRIAFGLPGTGQAIAASECQQVLQAYFARARLTAEWKVRDAAPRPEARLAMLLILCAESALPRGGTVVISRPGGSWRLVAEGPVIMTDPSDWALLAGDPPATSDLAAGKVHFALAAAAAKELGRRILPETAGERLIVSF